MYGTAEAGTRTQYVQCAGPWGQAALRLRYTYPTREAGARSPYVRVARTYPAKGPARTCQLRASPSVPRLCFLSFFFLSL